MATYMNALEKFVRAPFALESHLYSVIFVSFLVSQFTYYLTHNYSIKRTWYKSLPLVEQIEHQSRIVSTLHAALVFPIVFWVILTDNEYHNDPINGRNAWSDISMAMGVGYFLSDFILVVKYQIPPVWPIVFHHVFAGFGFLIAIGQLGGARWFGCYLLLTEATTPFNNTHWALHKCGMQTSKITKIVGYIFTINWVVFRLSINPFLLYRIYHLWNDLLLMDIYLVVILFANVVFLVLMNSVFFFIGPFYEIIFGETPKEDVKEPTKLHKKSNQTSAKSN